MLGQKNEYVRGAISDELVCTMKPDGSFFAQHIDTEQCEAASPCGPAVIAVQSALATRVTVMQKLRHPLIAPTGLRRFWVRVSRHAWKD